MQHKLSQSEITQVLKENYIGRIACFDSERSYVVPISYYYDEETSSIISYSGEGMKIAMLRKNPSVCFEVDQVKDIHQWKSVIAWGSYEELEGSYARLELHKMVERLRLLLGDGHPHLSFLSEMSNSQIIEGRSIVYRIRLKEFSGRAEN